MGEPLTSHKVNVMDFGAVGDGVADDTAAFQKALNLMGEASGGIVFAPRGISSKFSFLLHKR